MDTAKDLSAPPNGLAEDEALLLSAVEAAGDLALGFFKRGLKGMHKADNSPVSEADLAVDRLLHERLIGERPHYGWLSEETADDPRRLDATRVWIVDPIDGTRAFLAEQPEWTIAAALVERGDPMLAAVFNPVTGQMFTARRGRGAHLNGAAMAVRERARIDDSRFMVTRGFFNDKIWRKPWPRVERLWVNSIAYRLALIASGEADATLSITGKSEWDLAAAALLVQEAGGKATDAAGSALRFNQPVTRIAGIVAASPALHALLIEHTRPAMAKQA
ncbi:MAG: 3'(2'),5'-bisphosphate nucleotidase CysQ [Rhodomicrobium sp.]|nr:3'(2'),5'-bisphosphate nucleotidase CysQ [Rhodomicrobium sp.]